MTEKLFKRVVRGPKDFYYVPPGGDRAARRKAKPGETVEVTAKCANAFKAQLVDPDVAAAQKAADEAVAEAARQTREATVEAASAVQPDAGIDDDDDAEEEVVEE